MITRRGTSSGIASRGSTPPRDRFTLSVDLIDEISSPGSTVDSVDKDANLRTHTGATLIKKAQASVQTGRNVGPITFGVADTAIAQITANGLASGIGSGGTTKIKASTAGRTVYSDPVELVTVGPSNTVEFLSYVEGSLARHASDAVDTAIEAGDISDLMPMYSSGNTRNTNCWVPADTSCVNRTKPNATFLGNSNGWGFGVQAGHYPSSTHTYVSMANVVSSGSVASARRVGPVVSGGGEIRVVRYSTEVNATPAKLPPADLVDRFGYLNADWGDTPGVPVLATNQYKEATIANIRRLDQSYAPMRVPSNDGFKSFYKNKVTGDSGSGYYMILPDETLMILGSLTYGGAGSGPNYSYWLTEILGAIEQLGGDANDFTPADLTEYPNYAD